MLRKLILFGSILVSSLFVISGQAQAQQVALSASAVVDAGGRPVSSEKLCFQPVDSTGAPTGFRNGSLQVSMTPVCYLIGNGVLQANNFVVANIAGTYYHIWRANVKSNVVTRDYATTGITGSSWSLDTYDPATMAYVPTPLSVGTVTQLPPGSLPTASITGSGPYALTLGIPQGGATMSVGTVNVGTPAAVTNSGTAANAVLNFTLPGGNASDPLAIHTNTSGPQEVACIADPTVAPTLTISATTGGTGTSQGVYQYAVSFETANGGTLLGPAALVTTANGTSVITLSNIPLGASGTVQRTIWRTTVGQSAVGFGAALSWHWLAALKDNTTTTYVDSSTTDAALSNQPAPVFNTTCNANSAGTTGPFVQQPAYNALARVHTLQIGILGSPFGSSGHQDNDYISNATIDLGKTYNLAQYTETPSNSQYSVANLTVGSPTMTVGSLTLTQLTSSSFYGSIHSNGSTVPNFTNGQQYKISFYAYSMESLPMFIYSKQLANSGTDGWGAHFLQPHTLTRVSFDCVGLGGTSIDCGNSDLSTALGSGSNTAVYYIQTGNPYPSALYAQNRNDFNIYFGGVQIEAISTDKIAAIVQGDSKTASDCAASSPWNSQGCSSPWRFAEGLLHHPFLIRGHGGQTCATLSTEYTSDVHPYIANLKYYVVDCGVNDLTSNDAVPMTPAASATAIEGYIATMTAAAVADGIPNIVVTTIPPTAKDVNPRLEEARQLVNAWIVYTYPYVIDLAKATADYFDPRVIVHDPYVFPAVDGTHETFWGREIEGEFIAQHSCGNTVGMPQIFCWKQPSPYQPVATTTASVGQLKIAGTQILPSGASLALNQNPTPQPVQIGSTAATSGWIVLAGPYNGATGQVAQFYFTNTSSNNWTVTGVTLDSSKALHFFGCSSVTVVAVPASGCTYFYSFNGNGANANLTTTNANGSSLSEAVPSVPANMTRVEAVESYLGSSSGTMNVTSGYSNYAVTLSANITTFTASNGSYGGQRLTVTFCQPASGGPYTVAPSGANLRGFFTIGSTASKCSTQTFVWVNGLTAWLATGPGLTNQ